MQVTINNSPNKQKGVLSTSPLSRSQLEKGEVFRLKNSQTDFNSTHRAKINLHQLSAKIQGMQRRIRGRQFISPSSLRGSVGSNPPEIKVSRNNQGYKISDNSPKNTYFTKEQLRASWNDGVPRFDRYSPRAHEQKANENRSFNAHSPKAAQAKGNQENMNRSSAGFSKMEIPPIQGLSFDNQQSKSSTNKSKFLKQLKDGFDLKYRNQVKTKEEEPSTHEQKYRNSINKSIEMLELMKNIDSSSFKKQRSKTIPKIAKRIQGFTFGDVLGKGKFGEVYLARHIETGFIVAIKKVAKEKLRQYQMINQFIKEIKLHNSLDHPKIVKFYGFFEEKENIYLVIQYMNGGTLFDYLNLVGTLSIKEAIEFLKDVLDGLSYMHERSIAHRDIKPENIVISSEGVAKLCDFGWAAFVDNVRQTYCGTLDYASPQILERKQYDISVDMWSIGILTYQMLMGKAPFEDKDRDAVREKILNVDRANLEYSEKVPLEARQFIESLIQKDPCKRPRISEIMSHRLFTIYGSKGTKKLI